MHVETECGNNELTSTNTLSSRISPGDNSTISYWISNWFSIYFGTGSAQLAKCDRLPRSLKSNNLHRCLHGIITYVREFITRETTIQTMRRTIKPSQMTKYYDEKKHYTFWDVRKDERFVKLQRNAFNKCIKDARFPFFLKYLVNTSYLRVNELLFKLSGRRLRFQI